MNFYKFVNKMTRNAAAEGGAGGEGTGSEASTDTQTTQGADAAAGTGEGVVLGGGKPADGNGAEGNDTQAAADDKTKTEGQDTQAAGEADPLDVVPEDGKYELTLPEGVEIDTQLAEAVFPAFKEIGLTTGQANKLAEAFAAYRAQEGETANTQWERRNRDWQGAAKADKTYADVGYDNAVVSANRAIDQFGDAELVDALKVSGMGNHPAMIRAFYKAGAAMADDKTERGSNNGTDTSTPEERMYGKTTPTTKKG
jgi:hypothetical protein